MPGFWNRTRGYKLLVAGSASGELVGALRERGIDAWGIENNRTIHARTPKALRKFNKLICLAGSIYGAAKNGTAAVKYAVSTLGFFHERIIRPQDGINAEERAKIDKQIAICAQTLKAEGLESVV